MKVNESQQFVDLINSRIWQLKQQIQEEIRQQEQQNLEHFAETLQYKNDKSMKNLYDYVKNKKSVQSERFALKNKEGLLLTDAALVNNGIKYIIHNIFQMQI